MASPFCPCLACSSWASLTASPTSIKTARLASAVTVPRQARVPSTVAIRAAKAVKSREVRTASSTAPFRKSCMYQPKVKPPQTVRALELLKEQMIMTRIGA